MVGFVANYSCDAGFVINGVPTRTCGSTGAWTGVAPTCEGEEDIAIGVILGSTISYDV